VGEDKDFVAVAVPELKEFLEYFPLRTESAIGPR
jgi:hypothetical protein